MLRRRAKRTVESNESEANEESKKKRAVIEKKDDVEDQLEKLLFGEANLDNFSREQHAEDQSETDEDGDHHHTREQTTADVATNQRQPKWVDDDDEFESVDVTAEPKLRKLRDTEEETIIGGSKYTKKLRTQFEKIYGDSSWANLDRKKAQESDDEEEKEILQRTGNYLASQSEVLPKGIINIKRVTDANTSKPSNATIQSLEFHPSAKVLLTAGLNKTLDLFQIDGQKNPKLQSVFINKFPIYKAHFSADGEQVIMTSRFRKCFYVYDLMKGQVVQIPGIRGRSEKSFEKFEVSPDGRHIVFLGDNGYIILASSKTKQWIGNLKMNGKVCAATFSSDGSKLFSTGSDGEVYIWDVNSRTCIHKFTDDGCLMGTTIAASKNGQYLACGSDSGVVNVYDDQCFTKAHPTPLKAITNLTTSVDGTLFNSTSELLAISSKYKRDAIKLVHIPSFTVFSNWPTMKTPLRYINSFDFSPNSGFLSIGNDKGTALLYRLNHYTDS